MASSRPSRLDNGATNRPPAGIGTAVIGWFVVCFAIIPLAMAVHGDGRVYTIAGLVMLAAGAVMVLIARLASRPPGRGGAGAGRTSAPGVS